MIPIVFGGGPGAVRRILCLGAHSDDIEIGCGGTMLRLVATYPDVEVCWVVLSGNNDRAAEARCGGEFFLGGARRTIITKSFRDGFFPYSPELKDFFEVLKRTPTWDLIFTHHRDDRHQDHRVVADLTWNTFRNHCILEYEIPKYDGGLGQPNCFVPLDEATKTRKIDGLMQVFASQRDKSWFTRETFLSLMRLRGIECAAPTGYAEAFHARKLTLGKP